MSIAISNSTAVRADKIEPLTLKDLARLAEIAKHKDKFHDARTLNVTVKIEDSTGRVFSLPADCSSSLQKLADRGLVTKNPEGHLITKKGEKVARGVAQVLKKFSTSKFASQDVFNVALISSDISPKLDELNSKYAAIVSASDDQAQKTEIFLNAHRDAELELKKSYAAGFNEIFKTLGFGDFKLGDQSYSIKKHRDTETVWFIKDRRNDMAWHPGCNCDTGFILAPNGYLPVNIFPLLAVEITKDNLVNSLISAADTRPGSEGTFYFIRALQDEFKAIVRAQIVEECRDVSNKSRK